MQTNIIQISLLLNVIKWNEYKRNLSGRSEWNHGVEKIHFRICFHNMLFYIPQFCNKNAKRMAIKMSTKILILNNFIRRCVVIFNSYVFIHVFPLSVLYLSDILRITRFVIKCFFLPLLRFICFKIYTVMASIPSNLINSEFFFCHLFIAYLTRMMILLSNCPLVTNVITQHEFSICVLEFRVSRTIHNIMFS